MKIFHRAYNWHNSTAAGFLGILSFIDDAGPEWDRRSGRLVSKRTINRLAPLPKSDNYINATFGLIRQWALWLQVHRVTLQ